MPPSQPAKAGLIPAFSAVLSISDAQKSKTPPLVDASIHALTGNSHEDNVYSPIGPEAGTHPWNQALIETREATPSPYRLESLRHRLRPVGSHLSFDDLQRLA